ncbi:MAG: hypothetical protein A3F83_15170 [Candidatus Glassbacteria bacterium RIFCSPLOWO2_12_FULL_58_11]|uniref:Uncharacterized protein n=1 Tax=Candidatus Glassbacteria bacterium RIFCSPLOWO2_12_FULL_58_11 TaxID=1817867 RepID=A0A1F5Z2C5_9BACT|nr:MAG: hypothetical protein A3F83_15170 [Candidatus Glassbacteria bacterium RIFCSPLOWO2_12_FULL_58_11]
MISKRINTSLSSNKIGWILVVSVMLTASLLYYMDARTQYSLHSEPTGDALEYYLMARHFFDRQFVLNNVFLDRLPALPLLLSVIWKFSGVTALAQYLLGGVCFLAIGLITCLVLKRYCNWPIALVSMVIVLFHPAIIQNASRGMTEPLYIFLLFSIILIGFTLPQRPFLLAVPAAVLAAALVMIRQEGLLTASVCLIAFAFYYFKENKLNLKVIAVLLIVALVCIFSEIGFAWYVNENNLVPISYRVGSYYFYKELLEGKVSYGGESRYYALITFFSWLKMHSVGSMSRIVLGSLSKMNAALSYLFFPGGFIIMVCFVLMGLFSSVFIPAFISIPLLAFFVFSFKYNSDIRFLIPFFCLTIPVAMFQLYQIGEKKLKGFRILLHAPMALPLLFGLSLLTNSLRFPETSTGNSVNDSRIADQSNFAIQHKALSLLLEGQFSEAQQAVEKGLTLYPEWAYFHLIKGITSYHSGDLNEALTSVTRATEINPYLAEGYYIKSYILGREQQYEAALQALEAVLEWRPEYPPIRKLLEYNYSRMQRKDKLEQLNKAHLFNYYVTNPVLLSRAMDTFKYWNLVLNRYFPSVTLKYDID